MVKVGIIVNIERDLDLSCTKSAIDILLEAGAEVYVDRKYHVNFNEGGPIKFFSNETALFSDTDVIVTFGGDGTILSKCEKAASFEKPIIGVNLGHLGFLCSLEKDELPLLAKLVTGEYSIEERMMAEIKLTDGGISREFCALNEVVISSSIVSKLTEIEVECNGKTTLTYKSDGLIISTPSGSTAYSLSAGGPVIDATTSLLCLTPICPISTLNRPIIFSGDTVLRIQGKTLGQSRDIVVTPDGRTNAKLTADAVIEVRKSDLVTRIVRFKEGRFYDIVNKKLFGK